MVTSSACRIGKRGPVKDHDEAKKERLLTSANSDASLLSQKTNGPLLIVHAISSLDDAIDYANQSTESTLAASYIFAALPEANYLASFVDAHLSLVNHIPVEL